MQTLLFILILFLNTFVLKLIQNSYSSGYMHVPWCLRGGMVCVLYTHMWKMPIAYEKKKARVGSIMPFLIPMIQDPSLIQELDWWTTCSIVSPFSALSQHRGYRHMPSPSTFYIHPWDLNSDHLAGSARALVVWAIYYWALRNWIHFRKQEK